MGGWSWIDVDAVSMEVFGDRTWKVVAAMMFRGWMFVRRDVKRDGREWFHSSLVMPLLSGGVCLRRLARASSSALEVEVPALASISKLTRTTTTATPIAASTRME